MDDLLGARGGVIGSEHPLALMCPAESAAQECRGSDWAAAKRRSFPTSFTGRQQAWDTQRWAESSQHRASGAIRAGERQRGCVQQQEKLAPAWCKTPQLCAALAVAPFCICSANSSCPLLCLEKTAAVKCSFWVCSNSFLQKMQQLFTHCNLSLKSSLLTSHFSFPSTQQKYQEVHDHLHGSQTKELKRLQEISSAPGSTKHLSRSFIHCGLVVCGSTGTTFLIKE